MYNYQNESNTIQKDIISKLIFMCIVSEKQISRIMEIMEKLGINGNQNENQNKTKTIQCHICDGKYNNVSFVSLFIRIYSLDLVLQSL